MLQNRPLVAAGLLWTCGYAAAYWFPASWLNLYVSLGCGLLITVLWSLRHPLVYYVCSLLLVLAAAGYFHETELHNITSVPAEWAEREITAEGTIISPVEVDGDKASFTFKGFIRSDGQVADEEAGEERYQVNVKLLEKTEQAVAGSWQRGDTIQLQGTLRKPPQAANFGGFDYRDYLRKQRIHWLLQVKGSGQAEVTPPGGWSLIHVLRWNDAFRSYLASAAEKVFPASQSGFMKSMLIGLTDDMDPEQFRQFSKLGLSHILAISGLNVAIYVACCLWIMRRIGLTREKSLLFCMALLPLYILATGASPSIVRAGIMGMIALYAAYRHLLKDGLHSVMLAALLMLLWDPYYLFDVSFQLSFLVTIGLILGVPALNRLLPIRRTSLRDALSITVMSQLVSFPLSILYFNQLSLASLLANLLLVPVFSMAVMPAGTVALLIGTVWEQGGGWIGWAVGKLNDGIFIVVGWLSGWDGLQTIWPTPSLLWIVLYYTVFTLLMSGLLRSLALSQNDVIPVLGARNPILQWAVPVIAAVSFIMLLWGEYDQERWRQGGDVQFINVGQGDSILIRTPVTSARVLVDGGGTVTFRKPGDEWKERSDPYEVGRKLLVPLLKQRGVQRLDYVIMTHEDADHCGGLQAVLEEIPVTALLFNGTLKPGKMVEKLFETALQKDVKLIAVHAGQQLPLDNRTTLHFLYPQGRPDPSIGIEKNQNDKSVVFRMEMDGTQWLFTGDMEKTAEQELLASGAEAINNGGKPAETLSASPAGGSPAADFPAIDVLKVAHHGSKTSTTEAWLDAWKPKSAVISAGERNVYGHPHAQVVERLENRGIAVYRTDRNGEIQMKVEAGNIRYRVKREKPD
ncbi:DNA internalization-related competence protein ComEC/Rec2 [Paenibacillus thalictri]|uniref:DNA internalization-related competence protein ComEC/Rec2 n=1 Tax=Paenibacillus thalictri TaxID=2527873 RepID=A0A4Q9DKU3_9BACL|nr:DNA internalization-related competence protein ComEC/Rec2 [Paenibacillus thalictri]TBL75378.1 DNA internalization-related competence protein ComEC/Rec2 [Paenibacillus thalictri]